MFSYKAIQVFEENMSGKRHCLVYSIAKRKKMKKGFTINFFRKYYKMLWHSASHKTSAYRKYILMYFLQFSWYKISLDVFSISTMSSLAFLIYTAKTKMHTLWLWHRVPFYTVKNFLKNFLLIIFPLVIV